MRITECKLPAVHVRTTDCHTLTYHHRVLRSCRMRRKQQQPHIYLSTFSGHMLMPLRALLSLHEVSDAITTPSMRFNFISVHTSGIKSKTCVLIKTIWAYMLHAVDQCDFKQFISAYVAVVDVDCIGFVFCDLPRRRSMNPGSPKTPTFVAWLDIALWFNR